MNDLETKQSTYIKRSNAGVAFDTVNENEFNSLEKSAMLTVLIELRDSFTLKALTEIISDLNQFEKEVYNDLNDIIVKINHLVNDLIKIIAGDKTENQLRRFYTTTFRECLKAVEEEKEKTVENLEKISSSRNLKRLEIDTNLLRAKCNEKELEEANLCADASNYMINAGYEIIYVEKWSEAKIDQMQEFCNQQIEKLEKEISYYQSLIVRERVIIENQFEFLDESSLQFKNDIEEVTTKQEKTSDKLDFLISSTKASRNAIYKAYDDALETIEKHKQWVIVTRRADAAKILQRKWREILAERLQMKADEEAALSKKLKKKKKGKKK